VRYRFERLKALAGEAGLAAEPLAWDHPNGQSWIVFAHPPQAARLQALRERLAASWGGAPAWRRGGVIWLTGIPGAGKTTLSRLVADGLRRRGIAVEILDGDEIRASLSKGLGFSRADRAVNLHRIGYVARLLARNGVHVIVAAVSPYQQTRAEIREQINREGLPFFEVYVQCSLEVAEARDPKGMYRLARAGKIPTFTAVSDPYEPPTAAEITLHTEQERPEQTAARLLARLLDQNPSAGTAGTEGG
jgi:adenylyl-sulfate kinase